MDDGLRTNFIKFLSLLLIITCSITPLLGSAEEILKKRVAGDVNLDNVVSAADALMILQHSVSKITIDGQALKNADINVDNTVSTNDALLALQLSVNKKIVITQPVTWEIRTPINLNGKMTPDIASTDTPDPFITYDHITDYYYALYTCRSNITICRSKKLATIFTDERKTVYYAGNEVTGNIWAPEMYYLNDKWYIYTSGSMANDNSNIKCLFVLESNTSDPFDGFNYKSMLGENLFAIDPTVYKDLLSGRNYMCFSEVINGEQWLSISELINPWTISESVPISKPNDYKWEHTDRNVGCINEGPFFITVKNRLYIVYSANGCYNDDYCLGFLEWTGGDLLDKNNWRKFDSPIFQKTSSIFAPGHASFFNSPDNTETWVAYHCYFSPNSNNSWRERYCRVQKVTFDSFGFPEFDNPLDIGTEINVPSGE